MLSFSDSYGSLGRREFLKIGSLALGGLTLPGMLAARAAAGLASSCCETKPLSSCSCRAVPVRSKRSIQK